MLQIEEIHHVSLNIRDLERSRQFYTEILGLQPLERPAFRTDGLWFAIGDTGQQLHLILYPGETLRDGGIDTSDGHFALRIKSYEAAVKWLEGCNVEYIGKPDSVAGFAQIFLIDPDHNVIELNAEQIEG